MVIIFWFPCIFNLLVPNQKRSFSGNASHSRKAPLLKHELEKRYNGHKCVWFTHIVTLGGYLHRSHREKLALPREAYSPSAWWSTIYVNRRGHDVSKPYSLDRVGAGEGESGVGMPACRVGPVKHALT